MSPVSFNIEYIVLEVVRPSQRVVSTSHPYELLKINTHMCKLRYLENTVDFAYIFRLYSNKNVSIYVHTPLGSLKTFFATSPLSSIHLSRTWVWLVICN